MSTRVKITIALCLATMMWLAVLVRVGLWRMTLTPANGHLAWTFAGWEQYPVSKHLFLMQITPDSFGEGKAYVSGAYPFIFFNFLYLAPFHFVLGLPYNVAHNFLVYFYVFCLVLILVVSTRKELIAISGEKNLLLWFIVFISAGIVITDPLPWTSSFNAARDNAHILTAGAFCYLSTWVFYDKIPRTPLLVVGIFMALWAPTILPAWILAVLFFHRTLRLERKLILQVVGVVGIGAVNATLPRLVARLGGIEAGGSSLLFRSGLNGETYYMSSIPQAILSPVDPRHWPTLLYFALTAAFALVLNHWLKDREKYRPLQQALFLLIPYATFAIFLPQLTSAHAYTTDLFLFVPATFLMAFWSLQKSFWEKLTGRTYVGWLLFSGFVLMSNLLTFAQMPRFSFIESRLNLIAILLVGITGLIYVGLRLTGGLKSHSPAD